jgi:hypothetical protein
MLIAFRFFVQNQMIEESEVTMVPKVSLRALLNGEVQTHTLSIIQIDAVLEMHLALDLLKDLQEVGLYSLFTEE